MSEKADERRVDPADDPSEAGPWEPDEDDLDVFLPDEGPEPLPERGDFWLDQD